MDALSTKEFKNIYTKDGTKTSKDSPQLRLRALPQLSLNFFEDFRFMCFAWMCVCAPWTCLVPAKVRTLDLLELELRMAVSGHVGPGNWTQILCNKCSFLLSHHSSPSPWILHPLAQASQVLELQVCTIMPGWSGILAGSTTLNFPQSCNTLKTRHRAGEPRRELAVFTKVELWS